MEQLQNTLNIMHENCMVLNCVFVASVGLTTTQNIISLKAQDRISIGSHLTDTRSTENDWIGADTDPQYRIDASLLWCDFKCRP